MSGSESEIPSYLTSLSSQIKVEVAGPDRVLIQVLRKEGDTELSWVELQIGRNYFISCPASKISGPPGFFIQIQKRRNGDLYFDALSHQDLGSTAESCFFSCELLTGICFISVGIKENKFIIGNQFYREAVDNGKVSSCRDLYSKAQLLLGFVLRQDPTQASKFIHWVNNLAHLHFDDLPVLAQGRGFLILGKRRPSLAGVPRLARLEILPEFDLNHLICALFELFFLDCPRPEEAKETWDYPVEVWGRIESFILGESIDGIQTIFENLFCFHRLTDQEIGEICDGSSSFIPYLSGLLFRARRQESEDAPEYLLAANHAFSAVRGLREHTGLRSFEIPSTLASAIVSLAIRSNDPIEALNLPEDLQALLQYGATEDLAFRWVMDIFEPVVFALDGQKREVLLCLLRNGITAFRTATGSWQKMGKLAILCRNFPGLEKRLGVYAESRNVLTEVVKLSPSFEHPPIPKNEGQAWYVEEGGFVYRAWIEDGLLKRELIGRKEEVCFLDLSNFEQMFMHFFKNDDPDTSCSTTLLSQFFDQNVRKAGNILSFVLSPLGGVDLFVLRILGNVKNALCYRCVMERRGDTVRMLRAERYAQALECLDIPLEELGPHNEVALSMPRILLMPSAQI